MKETLNILLSFAAGLMLNFMPCVLPIMLIKIHEILNYKTNIKTSIIGTISGIIFTFLTFSCIAIIFKEAGKTFNFGFHFQNPYFLLIVIFLLFLFLLNLIGVFNFSYGEKITNFIQKKYQTSRNLNIGIFFESFLTAIFMVLFATPCSIPLIGSVAAFSLTTKNNLTIIIDFLLMGLGMSAPFIALYFFKNILNFFSHKDRLLKYTKSVVKIGLILIIIWLLYILYLEIGMQALIITVLFLLVIFIQFKIVSKPLHNFIILAMIFIPMITLPVNIFQEERAVLLSNTIWNKSITREEIDRHLNEGKSVFVSISAKWCMICNLNDITVFSKFNTMQYLNQQDLIAVKIDITNDNRASLEFYENPSQIYVPKYILFNKQHPEGCSFSGLLTEGKFIKEIKKCKQ